MPKTTKPATPPAKSKAVAAKSAARQTDSGPSRVTASDASDAAAHKAAQTQQLAAGMAFNPIKAGEHGFANGVSPQAGTTVEPASRLPTGSTLSETNTSGKVGSVAPEGVNATIDSLDRVRVDSAARALTTNQGVLISDNQN